MITYTINITQQSDGRCFITRSNPSGPATPDESAYAEHLRHRLDEIIAQILHHSGGGHTVRRGESEGINAGWLDYHTSIYEAVLNPRQMHECRQAFFAGALVTFQLMEKISSQADEDVANAGLDKLLTEIEVGMKQKPPEF